jgi:PAT family beta-lactamase induction signal transducer AmpG
MAALPFDPLATRGRRLASFFFLYVSEGLPYGFTTVAVATQMRRAGLGPAEIGAFVAALYLPWAFKWIVGPIVDTVTVERFGPRRFWILLTQILMAASLLAAMPVDLATQLALYTALIVLHNVFAATQDVAIDALACGVLPASERGVASGFMFGGQAVGKAIGGGGVLYLGTLMPFAATYFVVAAAILLITLLVVVPIRERLGAAGSGTPATDPHAPDSRALLSDPAAPRKPGEIPLELDSGSHDPAAPLSGSAGDRLAAFLREAWQAFAGRRAAWLGLLLALLPMGAMGLGLTLQTTLAVELGLSNAKFGLLGMLSALTSAVGCVAGGWMSDRLGRRRMSGLFIAAMSLPTVVMALTLAANGISEVELGRESAEPGMMRRPIVPEAVLTVFWGAVLIYNLFQGLMYGATTALFMDLTTPRVAGTQFTAYMALSNLAISFSAWWQGIAIERLGFPTTLGLDAVVGILGIGLLPFLDPGRPVAAPAGATRTAEARIHSG